MKSTLLFLVAFLTSPILFGQSNREEVEVTVDPNNGDKVVTRYLNDTLESNTKPWSDPLWEGRLGIGFTGMNGFRSGGIHLDLEAGSHISELVYIDFKFQGIFNQSDAHTYEGGFHQANMAFDSWNSDLGASFIFSDYEKSKVIPVSWKYNTPLGVRYEEHAETHSIARHRHYIKLGWNQVGGYPIGRTSTTQDSLTRVIDWHRFSISNLSLGYAYRMDRILTVPRQQNFRGKNMSRSRVLYADLLLNVSHDGEGRIMEPNGDGTYTDTGVYHEDLLLFSRVGLRFGYRGTYLYNEGDWGLYHKYELGWRPMYTGSSIPFNNVDPSSNLYFSASVGVQF